MHRINPIAFCLLLLALILLPQSVTGDTEPRWVKAKEKDGISVYISDVTGSDIIKVKTRITIDAAMNHIHTILNKVSERKNWIPYLAESRILQNVSETEKLEYSRFSAPWPASDRDFVYRMTLLQQDEHIISYRMVSEINMHMPESPGVVRADLIESVYTLTAITPQQTRVELIFHADPKGWLPVWIINIIQKTLPYLMLKNLRTTATS